MQGQEDTGESRENLPTSGVTLLLATEQPSSCELLVCWHADSSSAFVVDSRLPHLVKGVATKSIIAEEMRFLSPFPCCGGHSGRTLAFYRCDPCWFPCVVNHRFSHIGIVLIDAAVWHVFSRFSRFPHPYIFMLLHTCHISPSLALNTLVVTNHQNSLSSSRLKMMEAMRMENFVVAQNDELRLFAHVQLQLDFGTAECKDWGEREDPEKTPEDKRIATYENPAVIPTGIELGAVGESDSSEITPICTFEKRVGRYHWPAGFHGALLPPPPPSNAYHRCSIMPLFASLTVAIRCSRYGEGIGHGLYKGNMLAFTSCENHKTEDEVDRTPLAAHNQSACPNTELERAVSSGDPPSVAARGSCGVALMAAAVEIARRCPPRPAPGAAVIRLPASITHCSKIGATFRYPRISLVSNSGNVSYCSYTAEGTDGHCWSNLRGTLCEATTVTEIADFTGD
ncbi:hypothetical protein PR048_024651 [Dryococelus australis]|uniref:Uncharacterized protein n=1 Tax=Dryococelus australis TaxID=614101 RepID=A0ABQ9GP57_9NEOP|nr:hypothetical protein PR048_024651 [Dryococelus australis]